MHTTAFLLVPTRSVGWSPRHVLDSTLRAVGTRKIAGDIPRLTKEGWGWLS